MEKRSYSYTRQHLSEILNQVTHDSEVFCIERKNGEEIVMLDKKNYDALCETAYLLRSPENARKLLQGLSEAEQGKGKKIDF